MTTALLETAPTSEPGSPSPEDASFPQAPFAALPALRIGPVNIWPPVIAAPMAGETGSVLRILCKRMGAGLVCTELTSSHGLFHKNARSLTYLRWTDEEHPVSAQIFGAEPEVMEEAARMCSAAGADLIDINMGCWVPKVAKTGAGASLLKDLKLAAAVMSAVVRGSSVPVTIKTRVGWDGCTGSALELAHVAEDVGVAAIAIHGRTAVQGFTGEADWTPIAEAKARVRIPVIGNGDVKTPQDAERMFRATGCDAVMIGRAALGNPWIFREVREYLTRGIVVAPPTLEERLQVTLAHARLIAQQEGATNHWGTELPPFARGQLAHYLYGVPRATDARRAMTQIRALADVESIVEMVLEAEAARQASFPVRELAG